MQSMILSGSLSVPLRERRISMPVKNYRASLARFQKLEQLKCRSATVGDAEQVEEEEGDVVDNIELQNERSELEQELRQIRRRTKQYRQDPVSDFNDVMVEQEFGNVNLAKKNQVEFGEHQRFVIMDRILKKFRNVIEPGMTIKGLVKKVTINAALVDIGAYKYAILPKKNVTNAKIKSVKEVLRPGEFHQFRVLQGNQLDGRDIVLGLKQQEEEVAWRRVQQLSRLRAVVPVKIVGVARGGMAVSIYNLPGFLPWAQSLLSRDTDPDMLIDTEVSVVVFNVRRSSNEVVVSQEQAALNILQTLNELDVVTGVVEATDYKGVKILLDKFNVPVYVSSGEISNKPQSDAQYTFNKGDKVKAVAASLGYRGRWQFSMKPFERGPGQMLNTPESRQLAFDLAEETVAGVKANRQAMLEAQAGEEAQAFQEPAPEAPAE